jgi:hypothetical protein
LESEGSRFGTEFSLLVFMEAALIGSKVAVIEFLMGGHQVKNYAGQFVGRCGDG